jgi:hypothetical protein
MRPAKPSDPIRPDYPLAVLSALVVLGCLAYGAGHARADYIFTTLDVPGWTYSAANGINDSGQIVGSTAMVSVSAMAFCEAVPLNTCAKLSLNEHKKALGEKKSLRTFLRHISQVR